MDDSFFIPSRKARILVFADDAEQKPRLYACPMCGLAHSPKTFLAREAEQHRAAREAAEDCYNCKTHSNCQYCGVECGKGWTACEACRLQRKLEAAVEVPDDGGPYCEVGGDTYYSGMDEVQDAGLEWVSSCIISYPRIDADSVLENLLDDMHEDASTDDMDGVPAFYAAVKAFNEAQTHQSWFGDDKRKIRVPRRDSDGSPKGGDSEAGSVHDSADPKGIAHTQSESH